MADHYYTNTPDSVSDEREIVYDSPVGRLGFITDRGVFSIDRVDYGSDLLIQTVCECEQGTEVSSLLDIGCGYGPIALTLGKAFPEAKLVLCDVNDRAMALAARNAKRLGLTVEMHSNSEFWGGENEFELVVTNPPIRAGKKTVYAIFDEGCRKLLPGGRFYAVLQKKQGAESAFKELERLFGNCETVERSAGFHILRSVKQ